MFGSGVSCLRDFFGANYYLRDLEDWEIGNIRNVCAMRDGNLKKQNQNTHWLYFRLIIFKLKVKYFEQ